MKVELDQAFCDTPRVGDVGAHVITGIVSAATTICPIFMHAQSAAPPPSEPSKGVKAPAIGRY